MQHFAVFDIDKTIYKDTLAVDFIEHLIAQSAIPKDLEEVRHYVENPDQGDSVLVAALRAAQESGRLDFKKYVSCGVEVAEIAAAKLNQRVFDLFNEARNEQGLTTIAISTSPYAVVKPFCDLIGPFDFVVAPMAQNLNGVVGPRSIVRASERDKGEWLKKLVELLGLTFEGSIAIGDSITDAPMLELVDRPIVYKPTKDLAGLAKQKSWEIWT